MSAVHRLALAVLVALLCPLVGPLSVGPVAPAGATTGEMHVCTTDEIRNGKVMRAITLKRKAFSMTHAERKRIPRRTTFSQSVTMAKQRVVEASIKATATVKADAGVFFAKASVEAGIEVAGRYQETTSTSVTETFTIHPSKKRRLFVFYSGVDTFGFRVHKRVCNMGGQKDYFGRLGSFNEIRETGAVRCPHTRYKKGSIPYQVTLGAGC
jgi:hypothetical protein